MNWTTDAFLNSLQQQTAAERSRKRQNASHIEMKPQLIAALQHALGKMPQQHMALQPQLLERKEYDEFYMERIAYSTMDHVHVPVIVLIPKVQDAHPDNEPDQEEKRTWPAVLACHGHGNGQFDALGMDSAGNMLEDAGIHNRFAIELVRNGLLVVIPEIMGFGVRRIAKEMNDTSLYSSCATLSAQLLMNDRTLAGMRVYEAMRALDYIDSRSDVQRDKVGLFGFSGGSLIGAYTAALDERIKATVLCGWTNTFAGSILAMRHCVDNYLPGLLSEAEQPELMSLLAPRPLFVEAGKQDHIFPIASTEQAISYLQQVYDAYDKSQQFAAHIHDGGHEIRGTQAYHWLANQLTRC